MKYPGQAMPDQNKARRELLDPVSRISEILFGLLMALTFTTTFNAATTGQESVRTMFFAALGCNLAWGLVDAMIFLVQTLTERGYRSDLLRRVRTATEPAQAHRMIADSMPLLAPNLTVADFEALRVRLSQLPESAVRAHLSPSDFLAALAVFLLVVLATFPVVIPFLIMADLALAMRFSNGIAIAMMFFAGWGLGRYAGFRPLWTGLWMLVLGVILVAVTIALGG